MRKIWLFLLIPLIITLDETERAIVRGVVDGGLAAIKEFVPGGSVITAILNPIVNLFFKTEEPDPTEKVIEHINSMKKEITSRLDQLEKDLLYQGKSILDSITGTIYINSFGSELNNLRNQIEGLVSTMTITDSSKTLSNNEKIVENAYTIGSNKNWMEKGNIILNLKNLADTLAGKTFSETEPRDLYQIIYDSIIQKQKYMFSGEVYDDADLYIEKVMDIYIYGCSVIIESLRNTQLMSNFTDEDIESLSPLVKSHYYSSAVGDPDYVFAQIKFIADKVFDVNSTDSVISHYLIFKYKKKNWRNMFIYLGKTNPVPINQIRQKDYYYRSYDKSSSNLYDIKYTIGLINNEIKKILQDTFANEGAITPQQMSEIYDYYLNTYKNNTRFGFLSFLSDKGIDVSKLFDEGNEINFFVGNCYVESGEKASVNCKCPFLHSDKVGTNSKSALMTKGSYLVYSFETGHSGFTPYVRGVGQRSKKITVLPPGGLAVVPSTAEEVINSINKTITYINYDDEIYRDSYVELEDPQIIILGFSNYTNNNDNYTYNNESENIFDYDIHFISLNQNINSITIFHSIIIKYKNKLRNLDDEEIFSLCIMNEIKNKKYKASCIIPKNDSEIDNIEVIPDFNFSSDDNITIKMSSLANKQKNNIYNLKNVDYSSYNIYILENSSIIKNENLLFSINGIINENITDINNTDLILSLNSNTNETSEVKCQIININDTNYTLNCESNEIIKANLDSSISIINNNSILLITFPDSEGNLELKRNPSPKYYYKKSNKKIGAGAIALIVIIPILVIISLIAFICFMKKDNKNISNETGTILSVNSLNK